MTRLSALLLLAACATSGPAPGTAMITVASGGFFGSSSTQIFADGTLVGRQATPGKAPITRVQHGSPAAYAKAATVLAAEGAETRRRMKDQTVQCLDYGTDQITATPPVAGFDHLAAGCPDQALSDLMSHVLATLAPT